MTRRGGWRRLRVAMVVIAMLVAGALLLPWLLSGVGQLLVVEHRPVKADAVVVLSTGVDYYPRLIEAAALYQEGFADRVVVNGNRKTDVLRDLERRGFTPCCRWDENARRILGVLGVPDARIVSISAEDAFDTISEARTVGDALQGMGLRTLIVATSRFHTRRAHHIWSVLYGDDFALQTVAARTDPYDPTQWWRDGRQIRWVLSEYGGWLFYHWQRLLAGSSG